MDFALAGMMLQWRMEPRVVFVLAALNPVQSIRMALLSSADPELSVLGPVGFYLANQIGSTGLYVLGVGWADAARNAGMVERALETASRRRRLGHESLRGGEMTKAMDAFYRFLDEPIFPWARVVLALLTIFVGLSFTAPMWHIQHEGAAVPRRARPLHLFVQGRWRQRRQRRARDQRAESLIGMAHSTAPRSPTSTGFRSSSRP